MVDLKRVSGKAVVHALERLGFAQARQRGSHVVMKKIADTRVGCVVPGTANLPSAPFTEY